MNTIQTVWHSARNQGHAFIQNNRSALEPLAIATGVATVVVGSLALGHGLLVTKGAALAKGALTASTGGTTTGQAVPLNAALVQDLAQRGAALGKAATTLNQTTANGALLVDKVAGLANTVQSTVQANTTPFLAGAAGGGAAGAGVAVQQKRQTDARLSEQEAQLQAQQAHAEQLNAQMTAAEAHMERTLAETTQLREQRLADQEQIEFLQDELSAARSLAAKPDRLEEIKGIGPVYADLLHKGGITTFAQLAQQTPETLQEIVAVQETSRMVNVRSWITQAQALANEQTRSNTELGA